ncbi:hypothetical protein Tco_0383125 [Tanacetum coccineum]
MLALGSYAQWQSCFLRYIDLKPNKNFPDNASLMVPMYLVKSECQQIKKTLKVNLNDIYSTVDACPNAKEMWIAIEHLMQGESINRHDVKTKLFWEFKKFSLRDGESLESYYIRFYRMMNEMVRDELSVDTLQQHQNEVNDLRAERLAWNANPLALTTTTQQQSVHHPQAPKTYQTQAPSPRQTTSTRSHVAVRSKGKEIVKAPLLSHPQTGSGRKTRVMGRDVIIYITQDTKNYL